MNPAEEDPHLPDELARLPHGRHGLPSEFVEHNQRERLIASLIGIVGESGYGEATIGAITAGAGVSSRTFYKYFETVEVCFLAAFDRAVEWMTPPLAEAYESETEWPLRVRAVTRALLEQFSENPDLARLLTAEPFVAGPQIALRNKEAIERLVPYLRQGRQLSKNADQLPETTEAGLLGSASSLIGRRAFAGNDEDHFVGLRSDLVQFLLTPYMGASEAHQIAAA